MAMYDEIIYDAWLAVDKSRPEVRNAYDGYDRLQFQWFPEEISDSVQPNWEAVDVLGRSEPFQNYSNTSAREFTLDLEFYATGIGKVSPLIMAGGILSEFGVESVDENEFMSPMFDSIDLQVLQKIRFIQSLAYPIKTTAGYVSAPAECFLVIGKWLNARVIMTGAADITFSGPWDVETIRPYHALVSLTLTEVNMQPKDAASVLNNII